MTVRARLIWTWAATAALLLLPAVYAISRLAELRDIASEQRGRHAAAFVALGRLQTSLSELDRFQRSYVATPDPGLRRNMRASLTRARFSLRNLAEAGYSGAARETGARLDAIEEATHELERLVESGRVEEATELIGDIEPLRHAMEMALDGLAETVDFRSLADIDLASEISAAATSTTLFALLVVIALTVATGFWTTRALTQPLHRLRNATATVAAGEFIAPPDLPYDRRDEIGDLARSFLSMTEQLEELNRVRAEFISVASHDLKTPINVIGGYVELVEEGVYGDVSDKQREVLDSISEQTQVLTRLVNQLLDTSRIEAGGLPIELKEVLVPELFDSVERAFGALAQRKRIDFEVVLDSSLSRTMAADVDRLRDQVLGNLLSNAFKFTPEGGRITVRAWGDGDSTRIDVADTGMGIPPDQLSDVFEKYHQVGRQARATGSGLGLAIAREVVEAHGGTIGVESQLGRGTTFHIILPTRHLPSTAGRVA